MKHLLSFLNEDFEYSGVEDSILVNGIKINLEYELYVDGNFIEYKLYISNKGIMQLTNADIWFDEIDYSTDLTDARIVIYSVFKILSDTQLNKYGVDNAEKLSHNEAYDTIKTKIKFKFDKHYTSAEFVKFYNTLNDHFGEDVFTAVLKNKEESKKELSNVQTRKLLNEFFKSLKDKDFYIIGRNAENLNNYQFFQKLKSKGLTIKDVIDFLHDKLELKNFEKSDKLLKSNSKTGIFED